MKFENKLINLRKSKGVSQEQLAEALGVSRQAISRWESGDSTPDMTNLIGICQYFDVSADYLIFDEIDNIERISSDKSVRNSGNKISFSRLLILICIFICSLAFAAIAFAIFVKLI